MYSLIIPVYRNEDSLPELIEQLVALSRSVPGRLETVFVVDGSPDNSYSYLRDTLPRSGLRAKLILLSRNFGSFSAIRAGLTEASGGYFAVLAADLQEPPELAKQFFSALEANEADVVIGTRISRQDPLASRLAAGLFWSLYRRLVQPEIPPGGVDLFGCNRPFRDQLIRLDELNTSLVGLLFWLGFRRKCIPYMRRARSYGRSAWTLRRKLKYLSDSIFAFSDLPIRLLFISGAAGLAFAVLLGIVVIGARVTGAIDIPGYAATVITVLFFGALNTMGIGLLGAYTWRAFENTKRRPSYIISRSEEIVPGDQDVVLRSSKQPV